jgi:hypothetical protein
VSGIAADDDKAFLAKVKEWRDLLRDTANIALRLDGAPQSPVKIPDDERKTLQLAASKLHSIDELVKIVQGLPFPHDRAHALSCLCSVIGTSFAIGSHASASETQRGYFHLTAQSRRGKAPRKKTPTQKRIDELSAQHCRLKPNATNGTKARYVMKHWGDALRMPDQRTVERHLTKQK